MTLNLRLIAVVCVSPVMAAAAATDSRDLRALFPQEAPIFVDSVRLSRLELPPEVLAACRADLSDLRVFDQDDREVSFLVDSGLSADEQVEITQQFTPQLLDVGQRRVDSETGPSVRRETYELLTPDEVSTTGRWDLVIETDRPEFVRRVEVIFHQADGSQEVLLDDESIYRISSPVREKLRIALPELDGDRLTVILTGEDGFYLSPGFRFENSRPLSSRENATVELEELGREWLDGQTVLVLRRPRGLVPDVLLLTTTTGAFNRPVQVWDDGPGASDKILAESVLFRVAAQTTVQDVELPLEPAHGDRLRVIISDGDSPPLEDLSFQAVVRRPALLFTLKSKTSQKPTGMLRFGGGRAFRPRYDLIGLPPIDQPAAGETARIAERLYDPTQLQIARLGEIRPNSHFDPAPALEFAMRPGAEIDSRLFSHRRQFAARPSTEGMCRLRLQPDDLAHARPDLRDLRIVDGDSRQWAYLLENRAVLETDELPLTLLTTDHGRTRYRLALPVTPATIDQLVLETPAPFFDRAYVLTAGLDEKSKQTVTLATGRLARRIGDPRPVTIGVAETRLYSLELEVVDGDDSPLEISRVTARFPVPEIFFAAPSGNYDLLLGNPEADPPRYELARVRQIVLAVEGSAVDAGPLEENPEHRPGAHLATRKGVLQILLWVVVIAVVIFLCLLTLRLAKQEGGAGPGAG